MAGIVYKNGDPVIELTDMYIEQSAAITSRLNGREYTVVIGESFV